MMDVAGQCRFFNYLADLVDPKFYQASDREHVNTKYMKRDERAATKRAFKEQYKQNKRAKLDPDAVRTTTEVQQKQAEEAKEQQRQQEQHGQQMGTLHLSAGGQPSREELLKRLHAKMEVSNGPFALLCVCQDYCFGQIECTATCDIMLQYLTWC
eukprot:GHUV01027810.1.p2 GENE.GHUV01027810.1~~GHUV01027810.1.p2  ORF type:complete len:155 (+),score=47.92 GHUV01027810.1:320-784(+)